MILGSVPKRIENTVQRMKNTRSHTFDTRQSSWRRRSTCGLALILITPVDSFVVQPPTNTNTLHPFGYYHPHPQRSMPSPLLHLYAPPQSGYQTPEDEPSSTPETYDPTMEYPGTMRPGRSPENMPLHDLPNLSPTDPNPIPWPHFQEIDWYHRWGSPHPHPIPMDEFIDIEGRWATLEDEAEMRKDARRGVRERREAAEKEKTSHQVMDDTDDEDDVLARELGDGVKDLQKAAVLDVDVVEETSEDGEDGVEDEEEEEEEEDDFLLELGLDVEGDDDDDDVGEEDQEDEGDDLALGTDDDDSSSDLLRAMQGLMDMDKEEDIDLDSETDDADDDAVADLDLNSEDINEDSAEVKVVPIDNLDENDELDTHDDITFDDDNEYDDGGFDIDDNDNEYDTGMDEGFDGDENW